VIRSITLITNDRAEPGHIIWEKLNHGWQGLFGKLPPCYVGVSMGGVWLGDLSAFDAIPRLSKSYHDHHELSEEHLFQSCSKCAMGHNMGQNLFILATLSW